MGGECRSFHDGELGTESSSPTPPLLHSDSLTFRLAAARECFEESGILLARLKDGSRDERGGIVEMLSIDEQTREQGRLAVRDGKIKFVDWVDGVGGFVDTGESESELRA
jgi:8-oxo-dGTP pyrophosphatase MutT (NUDIX family)